ncbi:MAG: enoyl-CoA hydratase/isomerase family protein, partial [bacterium]|nr:enoyl-CoA hydratase/isomerase family protein [bacterium]
MNYEILQTEEKDGVLIVTISRPQALNALNSQFFQEINHLLDSVENNKELRAVIITGAGKAFVAGADIAEMVEMDAAQAQAFAKKGQDTFYRFERLKIPVIAAVNGFALGGGCELMLACDIRLATSNAKFGQPEV